MTIRNYIIAAWFVFAVSGLLVAWQIVAYLTDSIPDHILPLVHLLSGKHEAIPVAYTWTMKIAVVSSLAFLGSLIALVGARLYLRHTHNDKTRNA